MRPCTADGWHYGIGETRRVLYRLPEILKAVDVIFLEGEKDVDTVAAMGFDAAGFAFGASSFEAGGYADTLSGKNVYILPDNDEAGRKMVENVAHSLNGIAASVRVLGVEDMQPGWDITDFFEEHGAQVTAKAIILAIDQSVEYQPEDEPRNKNTPDNFFTPACDLKLTAPVWIIEGMLEAETLCQAYGAPEVGKSFFGIDVSACVAAGIPFHGKKVRQGPACYIAGEGQNGLMRRITAWAIRNQVDIKTLPLYVSTIPIPLCDKDRLEFILKAIDCVEQKAGTPALAIVDTLARNFGGNENDTQDMTKFVESITAIQKKYKMTVMVIHHTGIADQTRSRGNGSLRGGIDAEYRIEKDPRDRIIRVESTKMKDAPRAEPMAFKFKIVELPVTGDDGQPITSVVLDDVDYKPKMPISKNSHGGGKNQKLGQQIYDDLRNDALAEAISKGDDLGEIRISIQEFREKFYKIKNDRKAFKRVKDDIVKNGKQERNGYIIEQTTLAK